MQNSSSGKVGEFLDLKPTEREVRPVSHDRKRESGNQETHENLKTIL
jgi:hypothetical protein